MDSCVDQFELPKSKEIAKLVRMLPPYEGREVVYLIAPSGHPNYGDELIAAAWLRYLARARPHALVVLDCHTPGQASVLLRDCHPHVMFVDTAWRLAIEAKNREPHESEELLDRVVEEPGRACLIADGIDLLRRASSVHLLGGGYLNSIWPHHLGLLRLARSAARVSGAQLFATGQGLMPVGDITEVAKSLTEFSVFDVRDDDSARAFGLPKTGDDAWLAVPGAMNRTDARATADIYDTTSEAARRDVVLCLQSDLVSGTDAGAETSVGACVVKLLDAWGVTGDQVAVVEGIPGSDRIVFDHIAQRLDGSVMVPFTSLWRDGLPARPGQTWISTRFHPHLLAAAAGASGVALSGRTGYYDTKHRSLTDIGSRWSLLALDAPESLDDILQRPNAGGIPKEVVDQMITRKRELAAQLYPKRRGTARVKQAIPPRVRKRLRTAASRGMSWLGKS